MKWTLQELFSGPDRRILDESQGAMRLTWNRPRLWFHNGAITCALYLYEDGSARFDTLANVKPKTEGCNQNLLTRDPGSPRIWSRGLKLDAITWEHVQVGDDAERDLEARMELSLVDALDHADESADSNDPSESLMTFRFSFYEESPLFTVRRFFTAPRRIKEKLESDHLSRDGKLGLSFPLTNIHYILHAYTLPDRTDTHDHPVQNYTTHLNPRIREEAAGQIFYLENRALNQTVLFAAETPSARALRSPNPNQEVPAFQWAAHRQGVDDDTGLVPYPMLTITGRTMDLNAEETVVGDRLVIAIGDENIIRSYRNFIRQDLFRNNEEGFEPNMAHYMMSNTWGDRNRDARISEDFIRGEIDVAERLGIDIVQIDDGWQVGKTINSSGLGAISQTDGFYDLDPNYWTVDSRKFPNGLAELSDYAKGKKLELGLWFSPDPLNDFENWERDVETILNLQRETGIRWFKIDFVDLKSGVGERRYKAFLRRLMAAGIRFSQDVTAQERLGLVHEPGWGTIFLENRYTDWGNYYPHATLRNLWQLAKIMPAERLQMEFLNPRRNVHIYGEDIFAPANYSLDYLFFSICAANPLFWMELQSLEESDQKLLAKSIAVYKEIRPELRKLYVDPVGADPDGASITGFAFATEEGQIRYILVLKESGEDGAYEWMLPGLDHRFRIKTLASNTHHRAIPDVAYKNGIGNGGDRSYLRGNLGDEPYRYAFYELEPLD